MTILYISGEGHPVAWKLVPPAAMGMVLANFYAQEGQMGPGLKAIKEVRPPAADGIGSKLAFCMCHLNPAYVTVELENGATRTVMVARDQNRNWRMIWSLRD